MTQSKTKAFVVDAARCSGCRLCIIACKDEHVGNSHPPWTVAQPDTGHFWIDVRLSERGEIPRVSVRYLPLFCQHCDNAACIKACPAGAIHRRDDGLVLIDPGGCTACGLCREACPYDVIYMNAGAGVAQKCTGCVHRVDRGEPPRCVEMCPHEAIVLRDGGLDEREVEAFEVLHPEYQARPRVYWNGLPKPYIAGTVVSPDDGEVVVDANVTAWDLFNDRSFGTRTDAFGEFWFRGLEANHKYRVEIEKERYRKVVTVVTTNVERDLREIYLERAPSGAKQGSP
jgi:tetrathionate reductase subunit B